MAGAWNTAAAFDVGSLDELATRVKGWRFPSIEGRDVTVSWVEQLPGDSGGGLLEQRFSNLDFTKVTVGLANLQVPMDDRENPTRFTFDGQTADGQVSVAGVLNALAVDLGPMDAVLRPGVHTRQCRRRHRRPLRRPRRVGGAEVGHRRWHVALRVGRRSGSRRAGSTSLCATSPTSPIRGRRTPAPAAGRWNSSWRRCGSTKWCRATAMRPADLPGSAHAAAGAGSGTAAAGGAGRAPHRRDAADAW